MNFLFSFASCDGYRIPKHPDARNYVTWSMFRKIIFVCGKYSFLNGNELLSNRFVSDMKVQLPAYPRCSNIAVRFGCISPLKLLMSVQSLLFKRLSKGC